MERELEIEGGRHLRVRVIGEGGPATVLLHGWSVASDVWDDVVERWPATMGRLIVPDLRGAGWSAKPAAGYQLADYASDVVALVKALALEGPALVGHSMGGAIAQLVAAEGAVALRRLVLVCPVPASGVPIPPEAVGFFRAGAGRRAGSRAVLASAMAAPPDEARFDRLLQGAASVRAEAYLEGLDAWRGANFEAKLAAITAPTVVIGADAEPYLPPPFLEAAVVAKIPNARFVTVPGVGHYPMLEAPDAFVAVLLAALA